MGNDCLEHAANINGVEKGFIFPIHANNITIKGMDTVTILGSYDTKTVKIELQSVVMALPLKI